MTFFRLLVVATVAAVAVPAARADAVLVCTFPREDTYVCKDTARPECLGYGAVAGVEFELGTYCR